LSIGGVELQTGLQYLLSVMVFIGFIPTTLAEEAYKAPLVEASRLLDISASSYVVAVGERGHILLSVDGNSFKQATVPTQETLTAVTQVNDNIWAVGHGAIILKSEDKGVHWQTQFYQPEMERPFLDVLFFNDNHGIAVGAYGLFYRTQDGGASWQAERHIELLDPMDQEYLLDVRKDSEEFYQQELDSILPHFNRLSLHGSDLYLAGEAGLLALSHDYGRTFTRYDVGYTGSFFDISLLPNNQLLAVGLRGHMFVQDGDDWLSVTSCHTTTLNSIVPLTDKAVLITGNNGVYFNISLPISGEIFNPYANSTSCHADSNIVFAQSQDKSAVLNAVIFNDRVIAVSANGLLTLPLDK
jgi:photosystem II stability/assembly factor-like uncharacterized protein